MGNLWELRNIRALQLSHFNLDIFHIIAYLYVWRDWSFISILTFGRFYVMCHFKLCNSWGIYGNRIWTHTIFVGRKIQSKLQYQFMSVSVGNRGQGRRKAPSYCCSSCRWWAKTQLGRRRRREVHAWSRPLYKAGMFHVCNTAERSHGGRVCWKV